MTGITYSQAEMQTAARMADAMAIVPEEKRSAYTRFFEAIMLGAELMQLSERKEKFPIVPSA